MDLLPDNLFFDARWEPFPVIARDGSDALESRLVVSVENRSKTAAHNLKVHLARLPSPLPGLGLSTAAFQRLAQEPPQSFQIDLPYLPSRKKIAVHAYGIAEDNTKRFVTMREDEGNYQWRIPSEFIVALPSGHTFFQDYLERQAAYFSKIMNSKRKASAGPLVPCRQGRLFIYNAAAL